MVIAEIGGTYASVYYDLYLFPLALLPSTAYKHHHVVFVELSTVGIKIHDSCTYKL